MRSLCLCILTHPHTHAHTHTHTHTHSLSHTHSCTQSHTLEVHCKETQDHNTTHWSNSNSRCLSTRTRTEQHDAYISLQQHGTNRGNRSRRTLATSGNTTEP